MPAYCYECSSCQKDRTEMHGFNEKAELCPFCETATAKRKYTNQESAMQNKQPESSGKPKDPGKKVREFIEQSSRNLKDHKMEQKR